jgi:tetratricopeptide (TPR) repeat protein
LAAGALYKQAHLHYLQGRHEAALPLVERSLALRDAFYGPRAAASIRMRLLLSVILQLQGALPQAIEQAGLARQSFDDRVPAQLRGEVLTQLGRLHRAQGRCSDAIESFREARRAWEAVRVPNRVELAMLDGNIADCLVIAGEHGAAGALYDGVLQLLALETPADDPRRAYPLLGRGRLLLLRGERAAGIADLRAALELRAALAQDPALSAELCWVLGRALRAEGAGSEAIAEAVALARSARDGFAKARKVEQVAEIDAWLADASSP